MSGLGAALSGSPAPPVPHEGPEKSTALDPGHAGSKPISNATKLDDLSFPGTEGTGTLVSGGTGLRGVVGGAVGSLPKADPKALTSKDVASPGAAPSRDNEETLVLGADALAPLPAPTKRGAGFIFM
jgi:hypothetical protein